MTHALAADLLLLLHLGFILFVMLGGLLVLHWPRLAWVHLPAAAWGVLIELSGVLTCPLTPLEQAMRRTAGQLGYDGSFLDHYLVPLIYPPGLTRSMQVWLGLLVLGVNLTAYASLLLHRRRKTLHGRTKNEADP